MKAMTYRVVELAAELVEDRLVDDKPEEQIDLAKAEEQGQTAGKGLARYSAAFERPRRNHPRETRAKLAEYASLPPEEVEVSNEVVHSSGIRRLIRRRK